MSLYLAKKIPTSQDPPAAFIAKKLSGYTPAPIASLAILGISKYPEVAYGLYRTNIDAFCAATQKNEKVFAQAEGFGNLMVDKVDIPFSHHPLAFSPTTKLKDDQANLLLKKMGEEASMKFIGKTLEYTIPSPSLLDLPKYLAINNPNFAVGPDRFNPFGFQTYLKALSLVDMFLRTNYYPAFKDLDMEIPEVPEMELGMVGKAFKKGGTTFYDFEPSLDPGNDEVHNFHSVVKRRKLSKESNPDEAMDQDYSDVLTEPKYSALIFPEISTSVVYAKPSGRPSITNYGGPGNCPELPGLVFPYFKGMTRPDFTTIRECFVNFFFRLFGNDFESCKGQLLQIKRGINNLCNTEAGMEITHVMKGIDLALKTQTRLYLVFDHGYRGFVLLGAHFSVWDGSTWVDPVSPEEVKKELYRMDTHNISISRIADLLSGLEITSSKTKVDVTPEEISSCARLIKEMSIRDFEEYPDADEFDRHLQGLIWKTPFIQLSPDTFLTFLAKFFTEEPFVLTDEAIYIPSCKSPLKEKLFQLLARFGPDSPSLWNTRGEIISVIAPRESKKGKEKADIEKPSVPKEIIILPKPVLVAYKDWQRILKDGAVSFNYKERAKQHRGHVVTSESMRGKIWEVLQEGLSKAEVSGSGEPSKKKQKIGGVMSVDEILDLW